MEIENIIHVESVLNTFNLLKQAIADPSSALPELLEACKSQEALASLELTDLRIHKMSLNRMKQECTNSRWISWTQMDAARKLVLQKIEMFQKRQRCFGRDANIE
jgi:hypothetical protein